MFRELPIKDNLIEFEATLDPKHYNDYSGIFYTFWRYIKQSITNKQDMKKVLEFFLMSEEKYPEAITDNDAYYFLDI